jgi:hypothetical protein
VYERAGLAALVLGQTMVENKEKKRGKRKEEEGFF